MIRFSPRLTLAAALAAATAVAIPHSILVGNARLAGRKREVTEGIFRPDAQLAPPLSPTDSGTDLSHHRGVAVRPIAIGE